MSDKKGGHLALRKADNQLILRESAQCSKEDEASFQDVTKHKFFNTNNLWVRCVTRNAAGLLCMKESIEHRRIPYLYETRFQAPTRSIPVQRFRSMVEIRGDGSGKEKLWMYRVSLGTNVFVHSPPPWRKLGALRPGFVGMQGYEYIPHTPTPTPLTLLLSVLSDWTSLRRLSIPSAV